MIVVRHTRTPPRQNPVQVVNAEELRGMWQEQSRRLPGGSSVELGLEDREGLDEGGTYTPPPQ